VRRGAWWCRFGQELFDPFVEPVLVGINNRNHLGLTAASIGGLTTGGVIFYVMSANVVGWNVGKHIDAVPCQAWGFFVQTISYIVLGPSITLFPNSVPGLPTFMSGLVLKNIGAGMINSVQPLIGIRILKVCAGLERRQVAGALVSANQSIGMIGAILGPIIGSLMKKSIGIRSALDVTTLIFAVGFLPIGFLLAKYRMAPSDPLWTYSWWPPSCKWYHCFCHRCAAKPRQDEEAAGALVGKPLSQEAQAKAEAEAKQE